MPRMTCTDSKYLPACGCAAVSEAERLMGMRCSRRCALAGDASGRGRWLILGFAFRTVRTRCQSLRCSAICFVAVAIGLTNEIGSRHKKDARSVTELRIMESR